MTQQQDKKSETRNNFCAECSDTLKPNAKFCVKCGTSVQEKLQYLKQQEMEQPVITKKKSVKVSNRDNSKTSALFEEIDYEQYKPFRWTTYIQVNEELDNVLTLAKEMETNLREAWASVIYLKSYSHDTIARMLNATNEYFIKKTED